VDPRGGAHCNKNLHRENTTLCATRFHGRIRILCPCVEKTPREKEGFVNRGSTSGNGGHTGNRTEKLPKKRRGCQNRRGMEADGRVDINRAYWCEDFANPPQGYFTFEANHEMAWNKIPGGMG